MNETQTRAIFKLQQDVKRQHYLLFCFASRFVDWILVLFGFGRILLLLAVLGWLNTEMSLNYRSKIIKIKDLNLLSIWCLHTQLTWVLSDSLSGIFS